MASNNIMDVDEDLALIKKYCSDTIMIEMSVQSPVLLVEKKSENEDKATATENNSKYSPLEEWTPAQRKEAEELNKLPLHKMMHIIQSIHEESYELGVREAREISRCKYLGIFDDSKKQEK